MVKIDRIVLLLAAIGFCSNGMAFDSSELLELQHSLKAITLGDIRRKTDSYKSVYRRAQCIFLNGNFDNELAEMIINDDMLSHHSRSILLKAVLNSRKTQPGDLEFLVTIFVGIAQGESWRSETFNEHGLYLNKRNGLTVPSALDWISNRILQLTREGSSDKTHEDHTRILSEPIEWLKCELEGGNYSNIIIEEPK